MTTGQHMEQVVKMLCTSAVTVATAAWSMTAHIDATIRDRVGEATLRLEYHQRTSDDRMDSAFKDTQQKIDTLGTVLRRNHLF